MGDAVRNDMNILTGWIQSHIRIDPFANKHSRAPLTPVGVYNLRVADPISRDIFFVAACRTFGIPARLNPETHAPEYNKAGIWYRAGFEAEAAQPERGKLYLTDSNNSLTPQYALHFTIARIQDGTCKTLEFEEGLKLTDFPNPLMLETGHYLMVTGKRLPEGSVLSSLTLFEISRDKPAYVTVGLRKEERSLKPIGSINPAKIHLSDPVAKKAETLLGLMQHENSVIVLLDPDSEPSKHILNDLGPYADQFNNWKGRFIFVNIADKGISSPIFKTYKLPVKTSFSVDFANELVQELTAMSGKDARNNLPVVILCQTGGEVLLFSSGYKIGIGEQIMQVIKSIAATGGLQSKASCTSP